MRCVSHNLGIKDFAIVHDGTKTSKYANPRHIKKHQTNLARKQKKLSRKRLVSGKMVLYDNSFVPKYTPNFDQK